MAKIKAPTETGRRVNELIIKGKLSPEAATRQILGQFNPVIPPDAQILSRGVNGVTFIDAQGFLHQMTRNGDATSADFGRVNDETNRPAVLSATDQIPGLSNTLSQAQGAVNRGLSGGLAELTPETLALLKTIEESSIEQLRQKFTKEGGDLVASLFARGMNESTLAGDAVGRLQQSQGLVLNDALSDSASRNIGLRQFLTQLSTGAGVDTLLGLTGQETSRALGAGQLALGGRELEQRGVDSARSFQLEKEKLDIQRQGQSPWRSILSAVASLGAAAIPGIGPFISAGIGAATRGSDPWRGDPMGPTGG